MQTLTMGLGRLLLGGLFVIAGAGKIMAWEGTLGHIQSRGFPVTEFYGYPASQIILAAVIALEIGGGLMLITGLGAKAAAVALAVFTLVAGAIFHNFWTISDAAEYMDQFNHFIKNAAIVGGLLVVAAQPSAEDRYNY